MLKVGSLARFTLRLMARGSRLGSFARLSPPQSSSETIAFSSRSSFTEASIFARE